jgi:hypothetical protein
MPQLPNLDYEPGPQAASYSRVGPPPPAGSPPAPPPGVSTLEEFAEEIGVPGGAQAGARRRQAAIRRSRRRYKYQ